MRVLFNLVISVVLFAVGAVVGVKRAIFLMGAERGVGVVQQMHAANAECGGKHKYACTRFTGDVRFVSKAGAEGNLSVSGGSVRGYDKPLTDSLLRPGSQVPVVFKPNDVKYAFRDTFVDLWMLPLGSLGGSGVFFLSALVRRRRR